MTVRLTIAHQLRHIHRYCYGEMRFAEGEKIGKMRSSREGAYIYGFILSHRCLPLFFISAMLQKNGTAEAVP